MNLKTISVVAAGAIAICAASAAPSYAEAMKVSASLTPSSEVPPAKSEAKGDLMGTYDPSTKRLEFTATYSGLTGTATMAHLHAPAPTGKDAPIEIPIKGSVASPIKGDYTLTDAQAKNLADGDTYFNVHTKENPGGEIRGQMLMAK